MDIAVNKPAKDFLRKEFQQWYSEHVMKQLEGQDITDVENAKLQPIDLGLPALQKIGVKWLVDMASYISDNPQFIVNGPIRAGIAGALDAHYNGDQPSDSDESGQGDSDESGQDDSDESGQDDSDESGQDVSDETGEEETDDDDDEESVISEEEEINDADEHKSDEEDSVYEDGNGAVAELEPRKESDCEDI